jgi:hypothetical protein
MIPLIKPSGVKVYVNSESLEYALSLGWITEEMHEQQNAVTADEPVDEPSGSNDDEPVDSDDSFSDVVDACVASEPNEPSIEPTPEPNEPKKRGIPFKSA